MISSLFDKTLQLFGRGFLISAFVPTVITTVVLNVVVRGHDEVAATINRWSTEGFGEAAFEIAAWLVLVYLVAYVVYGARTVIRSLFQGMWPGPLRGIQHLAERWAVRGFRRQRRRRDRATDRKNDVAWIDTADPSSWPGLYHPDPPEGSALDDALARTERLATKVEHDLTRRWAPRLERHVLATLTAGRAVMAATPKASEAQRARIAELALRFEALRAQPRFAECARRAGAWIERIRAETDSRFVAEYPPREERVRATIFGNVMANLYAYSEVRYGIPLDVLWPRLTHVLPDTARQRVDDATILVDFSVISAAAALVVAGTSAAVRIVEDDAGQRAAIAFVAAAVAYYVLVRVTITAARSFADEVVACVDLHRHELLEALGLPVPDEITDEKATWHRVYLLLSRGELPVAPG